ncbi:MAG: hypothetical protein LBG15_08765 [Dysgonamonadaceae bacterium]|jgi:uncharacterized protein (TIGR02145 family)|nr:hypothetical protein [Dysgonamonadaceae bacterium]
MKRKMIYFTLTLWMLSAASVKAQVTIGSDQDPHKGAVLDLSQSTNLGLLLPHIYLMNISDWQLDDSAGGGEGMLIYNENDDVPGGNGKDIYVWTGNAWKPVGLVIFKSFSLNKSLLFLDLDGKTGTITAQNFTGSDNKPLSGVQVEWSIEDANNTGSTISPDGNTVTVTSGNTTGSFTVRATTDGITQDCTVTIVDCSGVEDVEGNTYYTAQFGAAGCWMTQNLRTKTYADGITTLTLGFGVDNTSKFYNYPQAKEETFDAHEEYGLLYTWPAASGRTDNTGGETNNPDQPTYQGICPTGWHLPSDYEWNQLEKEIANSVPGTYGTGTTTEWNTNWETTIGFRGSGHATVMRRSLYINNLYASGTSYPCDAGGFDVLCVGYINNATVSDYGFAVMYWTSSLENGAAWRRSLVHQTPSVFRALTPMQIQASVRCKKN